MSITEVRSPEAPEAASGLSILRDQLSTDWATACDIEATLFVNAGYVENAEQLAREYEKYLPSTRFIIAKKDGEIAGCVRMIDYEPAIGLKTLDDISTGRLRVDENGQQLIDGLNPHNVVEVGTIGVQEEFRSDPGDHLRVSVELYGAIEAEARNANKPYVLASFDKKFYRAFKGIFGQSVHGLGPAAEDYMGSPTVPVLIDAPLLMVDTQQNQPDLYRSMREAGDKILRVQA